MYLFEMYFLLHFFIYFAMHFLDLFLKQQELVEFAGKPYASLYHIPWVWPPPSKSHHQDHYIFSRESL